MRSLVIGYGSIGQRHARILSSMGLSVAVVSSREQQGYPRYADLADALQKFRPEYVVVANRTSEHRSTLERLRDEGFGGRVLVEKPIFADVLPFDAGCFRDLRVGYNLRFHPAVVVLAERLRSERILSAQIYVGKYLPEWRPGSDYRRGYSASRALGGGVLRDLSHELDLALWLFGDVQRVFAEGGRLSDLEIDADDTFALLLSQRRAPAVTIQMNYCDRIGHRSILVNTAAHTYHLDLLRHEIEWDGGRDVFSVDRDDTYVAQHQSILKGEARPACSYEEAMAVMRLIEAAEESDAKVRPS